MIFHSNGRYIDKRKLWRADNAKYVTCSTLHDVYNVIEKVKEVEGLKYVFINVGVNDCDIKEHQQVFDEMKSTIDKIRQKIPNVKIIMSEITPRTDDRDDEVMQCNELLHNYAYQHDDIFVTVHKNLRDATWSMFRDNKHIHEFKIPKFAANIIRALKMAYKIKDKRVLFEKDIEYPYRRNYVQNTNITSKLESLANYRNYEKGIVKNTHTNFDEMCKRLIEVIDEFSDYD